MYVCVHVHTCVCMCVCVCVCVTYTGLVRCAPMAAFLEALEPHILSDRLPSLAPEVVQALVEYFATPAAATATGAPRGPQPQRVERCVLHLDVFSLDLNQVCVCVYVCVCIRSPCHGSQRPYLPSVVIQSMAMLQCITQRPWPQRPWPCSSVLRNAHGHNAHGHVAMYYGTPMGMVLWLIISQCSLQARREDPVA